MIKLPKISLVLKGIFSREEVIFTKRAVSLFLGIFIMAMCLAACGGEAEPEFDPTEEVKSNVKAAVMVECKLSYSNVKNVLPNVTTVDIDGDTYTVKGKANIVDDFGDKYSGNFTAVYTYDEESQSFSKVSLDIDTPMKQ